MAGRKKKKEIGYNTTAPKISLARADPQRQSHALHVKCPLSAEPGEASPRDRGKDYQHVKNNLWLKAASVAEEFPEGLLIPAGDEESTGIKSAYCGTSLIFDAVRRLLLLCCQWRRLILSCWRAFTPAAYWRQLQKAQVRWTCRHSCRTFEEKATIGKLVRKDVPRQKFPGLVLGVNSKLSHRCSQENDKLYRRRRYPYEVSVQ